MKHHVPDWEQDWALQFCAEFASTLGLPRMVWSIGVEPSDESAWAAVRVTEPKRHVTVWLCPDWSSLRARDRCRSLVHEVLHVTHSDVTHLVETELPEINEGSAPAENLFLRQFTHRVEQWVDGMALAWWEHTNLQERFDQIGAELRPAKRKKGKR